MSEFTPVLREDIPEETLEPLRLDPLVKQLKEAQTLLRGIANWCIGVENPRGGAPVLRTLAATVIDSRFDWELPLDKEGRLEPRFIWWAGPSQHRQLLMLGGAASGEIFNSHGQKRPRKGNAPNTAINLDSLNVRELGSVERETILDYFNGLRVPRGYESRYIEEFSGEYRQGERALLIAAPLEVTLPVERRDYAGKYSHSGNVRIPPSALIEPTDTAHHVLFDPQP